MSSRFVMTEHAAWRSADNGRCRLFAQDGRVGCWITVRGDEILTQTLGADDRQPGLDSFVLKSPDDADAPDLFKALASLGTVVRYRTPNLWDAIGTAIIRQVIRAGHAKQLYRNFCDAYGQRCSSRDGRQFSLFPEPKTILRLTDEQYRAVGMTFKRNALRAAALAYNAHHTRWVTLPPSELVGELQKVSRIGPWTAGAAVADFSNDFRLYPYADLAVRTWAARAAPSQFWPDDEQAFAQRWAALAGEQLATLTLLTLAWGAVHGESG
jgi:DNA-3-methyladenine glycosylase II